MAKRQTNLTVADAHVIEGCVREIAACANARQMPTPQAERVQRNLKAIRDILGKVLVPLRGMNRDDRLTTPAYKDSHPEPPLTFCAASRGDGECIHLVCPQLADKEPETTGRTCPLPRHDSEL